MPFDWKEFFFLALFLDNKSGGCFSNEAALRSGVSRAYYAAFCHIRNYAQMNMTFIPNNDSTDHPRLRTHFKSRRDFQTASDLDDLRKKRNMCDYGNVVSNVPIIYNDVIRLTQRLLARF